MGTTIVKTVHASETRALRHLVLWPHLPSIDECVIDIDLSEDAFHLGTLVANEMVAIGSFFPMSTPKLIAHNPYRLRAMAVHPDFRGQNHGQDLIDEALKILSDKGVDVLWCDARIRAVHFYQNIGFKLLPEIYEIPNIGPHQFMWKTI